MSLLSPSILLTNVACRSSPSTHAPVVEVPALTAMPISNPCHINLVSTPGYIHWLNTTIDWCLKCPSWHAGTLLEKDPWFLLTLPCAGFLEDGNPQCCFSAHEERAHDSMTASSQGLLEAWPALSRRLKILLGEKYSTNGYSP